MVVYQMSITYYLITEEKTQKETKVDQVKVSKHCWDEIDWSERAVVRDLIEYKRRHGNLSSDKPTEWFLRVYELEGNKYYVFYSPKENYKYMIYRDEIGMDHCKAPEKGFEYCNEKIERVMKNGKIICEEFYDYM